MAQHYNINWLTERFESGDILQLTYFWGHTRKNNEAIGNFCFSQWFVSPFTVDNIVYKTAEHWMMAQKTLLFGDIDKCNKIIRSANPVEAKELGRLVLNYDEQIWNDKKFDIVKLGNIHKFNQHPNLAAYLLNTDDQVLVEASPIDKIWGIGLAQDDKDIENIYAWRGQNLLGFALMETRDFLKQFGHFKPLENVLQAPWKQHPNIDSTDMFWRMGKGEDYLKKFYRHYEALSERDKIIFRLTNPAPYEWTEFYD